MNLSLRACPPRILAGEAPSTKHGGSDALFGGKQSHETFQLSSGNARAAKNGHRFERLSLGLSSIFSFHQKIGFGRSSGQSECFSIKDICCTDIVNEQENKWLRKSKYLK
jgi:hypothetical protein